MRVSYHTKETQEGGKKAQRETMKMGGKKKNTIEYAQERCCDIFEDDDDNDDHNEYIKQA